MYLVSIYFDKETNKRIQRYIDLVAERTGNIFMTDGKVPPHITVSAFETRDEEKVKQILEEKFAELEKGKLTWCSVGTFFPYVIYLAPVLNEYIQKTSEEIYMCLLKCEGVEISKYYRPFQWIPHSTIGKKLSREEMRTAFEVLQENFGVFEGTVTHVGLAKPNPHRDLIRVELKDLAESWYTTDKREKNKAGE